MLKQPIKAAPDLTEQDIRDLIKKERAGDTKAGNKLTMALMPLVENLSRKYPKQSRDDLVQEGWRGLVSAMRTFDMRTRDPFASYAADEICYFMNLYYKKERAEVSLSEASLSEFEYGQSEFGVPEPVYPKQDEPCVSQSDEYDWMLAEEWENSYTYHPVEGHTVTCSASSYWPDAAIAFVKGNGIRRRTDRLIAQWLWLSPKPPSKADIARRLSVSRSAVTQANQRNEKKLVDRFGLLQLTPKTRSASPDEVSAASRKAFAADQRKRDRAAQKHRANSVKTEQNHSAM